MSCVPLFLCGEGHSQPRVGRKAVDRVEIRSRHSSRLIRYAPVFCLLFLLNIQIRINYGLNIFCHFAVASYQTPQRNNRMPLPASDEDAAPLSSQDQPSPIWKRFGARLSGAFSGADPRVCVAFWLFGTHPQPAHLGS